MLYRPVAGDTAELQAQIKEITLPYKKLKEMRPEDKARLSKTSASMVPVAWSAGEGSPNLQIWSKTPKLTDLEISTIKARTPHFYGFPEGPAGKNMLSLVVCFRAVVLLPLVVGCCSLRVVVLRCR